MTRMSVSPATNLVLQNDTDLQFMNPRQEGTDDSRNLSVTLNGTHSSPCRSSCSNRSSGSSRSRVHSFSFRNSTRMQLGTTTTAAVLCYSYLLLFWSCSWFHVISVSADGVDVAGRTTLSDDMTEEDVFTTTITTTTAKTGAVRIRRMNNATATRNSSAVCHIVNTVPDFDIELYASRPWYSHQQAVNFYLPIELSNCVRADYNVRDRPTFPWGYTVDVKNQAQDENGKFQGGNLCAYQTDLTSGSSSDGQPPQPGKLAVAPCFLPKIFAGPYWVLLYNEDEGYALISGGQPTIPSYVEDDIGDGQNDKKFIGCRTGRGINDSGLWIFSRSPVRDQEMIDSVRAKAMEMGIDVTVLIDVNHQGCIYDGDDNGDAGDSGTNEDLVPTPVPSSGDGHQCMDSAQPFKLWFDVFGREQDCDWVQQRRWWRCIFYRNFCPNTCGDCSSD